MQAKRVNPLKKVNGKKLIFSLFIQVGFIFSLCRSEGFRFIIA